MQTAMIALFVLGTLLGGSLCAQWSADPADGVTVYVCEGQDLTLPWYITMGPSEQIIDIQWLFQGHSDQMIAVYTRGLFLPTPPYTQRVQHVPSAGITLHHVTPGDVGNYTVEVNMDDASNTHVTHRRTVSLHVASVFTARTDATLEVRQEPAAVYDNQTGQFHIQLTCTSHGRQPPAVVWTTPSQQTLPSSMTEGDTFSLLLANPVTGGNYTCRLPPDSPAAKCLPANDPLVGATVHVDKMEARLLLLEAENRAMRADISRLQNRESKRVIFHAQLSVKMHLSGGSHIGPTWVSVNEGGAYNSTTGEFTVPVTGTYFFTATTAAGSFSVSTDYYADVSMMVDSTTVSYIRTKSVDYYQQGTCSYAAHLTRGQRVWLRANADEYFHSYLTTFTGFLVSAD